MGEHMRQHIQGSNGSRGARDDAERALTEDVSVDIGGILRRLWSKRLWLLLVPLLATVIAFGVLQVVDPRYRAQADIFFQDADEVLSSDASEDARRASRALDEQGIASQVELLRSRRIARHIIERFDLATREEFDPERSSSPIGGIKKLLGLESPRRGSRTERVMEAYFDRLKVFQANGARVVTVEFSSTDPELAALVPNEIAAEHLRYQEGLKRGVGPSELGSMRKELASRKALLEDAEAAVARKREEAGVFDGSNNGSLATQELSELVSEISRQRSRRAQLEARASAIQRALNNGSLASAPGISESPLIQRLRERQANLNSRIAELSTSLLPGHPRIRALQRQVADLNSGIRQEARAILRSLQQEAAIARDREQALIQERDAAKDEASRVRGEQVKLDALEREAEAQRQVYNRYLLRFNDAESRASREFVSPNAVISSRAFPPAEPYFPKTLPTLIGTFVGMLLLTAVIIIAIGLAGAVAEPQPDRSLEPDFGPRPDPAPEPVEVTEPEAVAEKPEPIAPPQSEPEPAIVTPSLAPQLAELSTPSRTPPSDENGVVPTARILTMFGRARLVLVSPEGPEGSLATLALGRELAAAGSSAVAIDLSGASTISEETKLSRTRGLGDLVAGTAEFAACIHAAPGSSLHILPMGLTPIEDAEALRTSLPQVLDALEAAYDFVLIDCGTVKFGAVARVSNDTTLLVVNAPRGETRAVRDTVRLAGRRGYEEPLILTPERETA